MAQDRRGPLVGLRVLELGGIGPAAFAAMHLADLGAEVLRIDRSGAGFDMPVPDRMDTLQRGKHRVRMDLKHPHGAEAFLSLVEDADVVIDSYRPGVMERLGIGPEVCLERNPSLVVGRMTGWGQEGPLAERAGHDPTYIAMTGALHAIGRAGGPPQLPLSLVGDFGGGAMYLITGILAGLWESQRSGRGQIVDAAIVDGVSHLMASPYSLLAAGSWVDRRGENLVDSGAPFVDVYETSDGRHMVIAPLEPQFFAEFARLIELDEDWNERRWDPSTWPALREAISRRFLAGDLEHWVQVFDGTDACVSPVLNMHEAPDSPQLSSRGTFFRRPEGHVEPAPAPRFSRTSPGTPAEAVGAVEIPWRQAVSAWRGDGDVSALQSEGLFGEGD